jgi:maleamate amidohydrolase
MTDSARLHSSVPSNRPALLLVDLQEEHRRDARFLAADYDAALANARKLLAAGRANAVPVFHAQYVRDFAKVPPRPFEMVGAKGEPGFSDVNSTDLIRICPEVAPIPGETVIVKNDASCFTVETLAKSLKEQGIEWLVVAGAWTEACVAATVRDATAQGFRVLLVKDACASGSRHMHRVGILNLANRLLGGGVADTARAARILSGAALEEGSAGVWSLPSFVPFRFDADTVDTLYDSL